MQTYCVAYLKMNYKERLQKLKASPETSAIGTLWTTDEEMMLIRSVNERKDIEDIAREHRRTVGGIRSRMKEIAVRMITKEGKTIEEVSSILLMSHQIIEEALVKRRQKESLKEKPSTKQTKCKTDTDILRNIRTLVEQTSNSNVETELDILKDIRSILLRIETRLQS